MGTVRNVSDFWCTSRYITPGRGFEHFDGCHMFWLLLTVGLCIVMSLTYRKAQENGRRRIRRGIGIWLVAGEVANVSITLFTGQFRWSNLPLQLCDMNAFLVALDAFWPSMRKKQFLYATGISGCVAAITFPTWTKLPMWNFMHIHGFYIHILVIVYVAMLLSAGLRPNIRGLLESIGILLCIAPFLYILNKKLSTNFMFLNHASTGTPLVWFEKWLGTPGYIIGLPIMLDIGWVFMYLPWFLWRRRKKLAKIGFCDKISILSRDGHC